MKASILSSLVAVLALAATAGCGGGSGGDGAADSQADSGGQGDGGGDTGAADAGQDQAGQDQGGTDTTDDAGEDPAEDADEDQGVDLPQEDLASDGADDTGDAAVDLIDGVEDLPGVCDTAPSTPELTSFAVRRSAEPNYHIFTFSGVDADDDLNELSLRVYNTAEVFQVELTRDADDLDTVVEYDGDCGFRGQTVVYWEPGRNALIGSYELTVTDLAAQESNTRTGIPSDAGDEDDACVLPVLGDVLPCETGLACIDSGDGWDGTCEVARGVAPALTGATFVSFTPDDSDCAGLTPHGASFTLAGTNGEAVQAFWIDGQSHGLRTPDDPAAFSVGTLDLCVGFQFFGGSHAAAVTDVAGRLSNEVVLTYDTIESAPAGPCGDFSGSTPRVCQAGSTCDDTVCVVGGCTGATDLNSFVQDVTFRVYEHAAIGSQAPLFPGTAGEYNPLCSSGAGGERVYSFTAPVAGTWYVTTAVPGAHVYEDTVLSVWDGCGTSAFPLACDEDIATEDQNWLSATTVVLSEGQLITIVTEPWSAAGNGDPSALGIGLLATPDRDQPCYTDYAACDYAVDACAFVDTPFDGTCEALSSIGDAPALTTVSYEMTMGYVTVASDPRCPTVGAGQTRDVMAVNLVGSSGRPLTVAIWEHPEFITDYLTIPAAPAGAFDETLDLCFETADTVFLHGMNMTLTVMDALGDEAYIPALTFLTQGTTLLEAGRVSNSVSTLVTLED